MDARELRALFTVVAAAAPELREAGILELSLNGVSMKLAPPRPDETAVSGAADDPPKIPKSMWDDPASYGRDTDSTVPGIRKEK